MSARDPAALEATDCARGSIMAPLDEHVHIRFPAYCQKWSCPRCSRKKARKLAARVERTPATRFVTLTARPNPRLSPQRQLDLMNLAWRTLWKRWTRHSAAADVGYVRVVELTRRGTPHLHIALKAPYLPQATLSRWWNELTGNRIVDIRRIKTTAGLARYLAKYVTKSAEHVERRRKWSATRGFLPPEEPPAPLEDEVPLTWSYSHESYLTAVNAHLAAGGAYFAGVIYDSEARARAPAGSLVAP